MSDPLNEALRDATLAVLLGSVDVQRTTVDDNGYTTVGTVTLESAFVQRLRTQAHEGQFDDLLRQAMDQVDASSVARAIEGLLAERFLEGLKRDQSGWGRERYDWLQSQAKSIAVEACSAALASDEALLDVLRSRIGMEVERNKVSIAVQLSDPEP